MLPTRRHIAALLTLLATAAFAQQPRPLILLDPAHGGADAGATLSNSLLEKDVALALAARLKTTLAGANFAVITTRDNDPATPLPAPLSSDQRAGAANHAHPAACLLLHATSAGTSGIHIITSALPAADDSSRTIPWDTAQATAIPQSLLLANELGLALLNAKLPVTLTRATLRPLDNLTCPAIAIELAPIANPDSTPTPASDPAYQQHVAEAIATALTNWRTHTSGATR